ncbi:IS30 family transposase [Amaricoccus macauensis]|uniref:IS30 family transposase n=2 Tax=Amaricoccus macauensis TaxID=57001 RepID=UPI003C7DD973
MAHRELTLEERRQIEKMLIVKTPISVIAVRLGRHRSSIYREIQRNRYEDTELPNLNGYYGLLAQKTAAERRCRRRKLIRLQDLRAAIEDQLRAGWSPEQIAGRLRHEGGSSYVCHETIYAHVYIQSEDLARWLPRRHRKREPRHARRPRSLVFPADRGIQQRPEEVKQREVFGDWEADLMIFRKEHGPANVASMVERKTRFAVLFKNNDRRSKPIMNQIITLLSPLPSSARRSITFDRGLEFVSWRDLEIGMGTVAWFCDPQAPWQKGSVENLNGRVRRDLPRDTQLTSISNRSMKAICDRLNATPRKCLGYRTPSEAFREELRRL